MASPLTLYQENIKHDLLFSIDMCCLLKQVKRLVVVETEEMYNARKQQEEQHKALRPPIVISHQPQPAEAIKSTSGEASH